MKKLVLMFGILVSSVLSELPKYKYDLTSGERLELYEACVGNKNKQACKTLISKANLEQDVERCTFPSDDPEELTSDGQVIGHLLQNRSCKRLVGIFHYAEEYHISKALFERLCQAGGHTSCCYLGFYYNFGHGVKQDYLKARELYKKSCDMKFSLGCLYLATLYHDGLGVRQNLSIAKQYFGKACDLGYQEGCNLYRELNEKGVQ